MTTKLSKVEVLALKDLEEWELCEEIFWKKYRVDRIQEGDRNIVFFHNYVKAWRFGNFISSLLSFEGTHLSSY